MVVSSKLRLAAAGGENLGPRTVGGQPLTVVTLRVCASGRKTSTPENKSTWAHATLMVIQLKEKRDQATLPRYYWGKGQEVLNITGVEVHGGFPQVLRLLLKSREKVTEGERTSQKTHNTAHYYRWNASHKTDRLKSKTPPS